MTLAARVSLLFVPLLAALQVMGAHGAGSADFAGLVDIGGGRKMYRAGFGLCAGDMSSCHCLAESKNGRLPVDNAPSRLTLRLALERALMRFL